MAGIGVELRMTGVCVMGDAGIGVGNGTDRGEVEGWGWGDC